MSSPHETIADSDIWHNSAFFSEGGLCQKVHRGPLPVGTRCFRSCWDPVSVGTGEVDDGDRGSQRESPPPCATHLLLCGKDGGVRGGAQRPDNGKTFLKKSTFDRPSLVAYCQFLLGYHLCHRSRDNRCHTPALRFYCLRQGGWVSLDIAANGVANGASRAS